MLNNSSVGSRRGTSSAALALAILLIAPSAWAQVNVSGVRGSIQATDGAPITGATVTLVHEPSKNVKTSETNASGEFAFNGLRVGGPYTITVEAIGFLPNGASDVYLSAGKTQSVQITMLLAGETIVVAGEAPPATNTSARNVYDSQVISEMPAIGRDLKSVAQLTPELYVEGDDGAMSIGGQNNRFNSVTIDGVSQNDDFGLNANGYPTSRSPIALNAIEEISVETSPFDVRYGRFLGGNVNIVTKSGTNEFHGGVLGVFGNESLVGTKSEDDELDIEFREARYGLNLGGPIIKDKLHFFVSVEGLDATTPVSVGPAGSGAVNEVANVTPEDLQRVQEISQRIYDFNAGDAGRSLDELDLKLIAKLDWAISDKHRLSAKYQRTSGNVIQASFANDFNLPLTSNWYDRANTLDAVALRLYSDWTSDLSTEIEFTGKIVDNKQEPLNGADFMEAEIETEDGGTIVVGPDVFRHANKLDNDALHFKVQANYLLQKHQFTGGWEYDRVSIFNKFVPFSRGSVTYASIDDFEARLPESIFYSNSVDNIADNAAANWGYGIHALFLQDQYAFNSKLTGQLGVRAEIYQSSDDVRENSNFFDRHGFSNTSTINGKTVFMPRLGVTYRPAKGLNVRGGVGLYSGGTPNVWISNNYTNNGISIDSEFNNDPTVLEGFDGRTIPDEIQNALMEGDGSVDVLDPDFKIPSSWKASAGFDYTFDIPEMGKAGKDFEIQFNYTYTRVRDALVWRDLRFNNSTFTDLDAGVNNESIGTLPDGRPFFDNDDSDGVSFNARRGFDMLLTNTNKGGGHTVSISGSKRFPIGLNLYAAYAFQNIKEISPGTSSRSVSNYGQAAVVNPNDPELATSNYERTHRFIAVARLSRPLIGDIIGKSNRSWGVKSKTPKLWTDAITSVALFFERRSGQPYSYTYGDSASGFDLAALFGEEREFARRRRQLFYVPEFNDPNVILSGINEAQFNNFLRDTGLDKYRGQIAPRNAFYSSWINQLDVRISQDLPNPVDGHRARFLIDFENFGNLVNSDWGRVQGVGFPYTVSVVDVDVIPDPDTGTGTYVYSNLRRDDPERVNVLASVWKIQLSLMYEF